jgi:hypothetical protein
VSGSAFALRVLLSVVIGGGWIAITTVAAERLGARVGGILGGVPSTVAISLLFVGWTETPQAAATATTNIPFFVGVYGPLVLVYVLLGRYVSAALAVAAAAVVWLALTLVVIAVGRESFVIGLIALVVLITMTQLALASRLPAMAPFAPTAAASLSTLAMRGGLSGLVIGAAVLLAKVGGSVLGGAASAFPAVLLASIVITRRSRGRAFSNEVARTIMISAANNIAVYVTVVRFAYPAWGLVAGTCAAFASSLLSAYVVYRFMARGRRASDS